MDTTIEDLLGEEVRLHLIPEDPRELVGLVYGILRVSLFREDCYTLYIKTEPISTIGFHKNRIKRVYLDIEYATVEIHA